MDKYLFCCYREHFVRLYEDKLKALKCYESELKQYPHPRSVEGVTVAARKWGTVISREYAEPLEAIRIVK